MRYFTTLILAAGFVGGLPAAPPSDNFHSEPRWVLSATDAKNLINKTPLTSRGVEKLVGKPPISYRLTTNPTKMIWRYHTVRGPIDLIFERGNLREMFVPAE